MPTSQFAPLFADKTLISCPSFLSFNFTNHLLQSAGMAHHHSVTAPTSRTRHRRRKEPAPTNIPRLIVAIALVCAALATVFGLLRLWPDSTPVHVSEKFSASSNLAMPRVSGTVTDARPGICNSPSVGKAFDGDPITTINRGSLCPRALVALEEGPNQGKSTLLMTEGYELHQGQHIWLTETKGPDGSLIYAFADFQRGSTLLWWGLLIAGAVVAIGVLRGLLSLIGLAITFTAISVFLLPGLAHGGSPLLLALTCGSAILFLTLFLVHGISWKTTSALAGTLSALGFAAILARYAIASNDLQGLGDENNLLIQLYLPDISISGLMLCGFIIGALGVLNDVTIAQASTVNELYESSPQASPWAVFTSAMRVGQDHIASMVYTLVLSYTGAALPMLLLLHVANRPLSQTLTSHVMATELMRSGVGALAMVCAIPLTTAIAAFTVRPAR